MAAGGRKTKHQIDQIVGYIDEDLKQVLWLAWRCVESDCVKLLYFAITTRNFCALENEEKKDRAVSHTLNLPDSCLPLMLPRVNLHSRHLIDI